MSGLLGITVIGAVLTARQAALLTAGETPTDAFLGGYQAGLLLAAGLVALGGVAAFVGLRRAAVAVSDAAVSDTAVSVLGVSETPDAVGAARR